MSIGSCSFSHNDSTQALYLLYIVIVLEPRCSKKQAIQITSQGRQKRFLLLHHLKFQSYHHLELSSPKIIIITSQQNTNAKTQTVGNDALFWAAIATFRRGKSEILDRRRRMIEMRSFSERKKKNRCFHLGILLLGQIL